MKLSEKQKEVIKEMRERQEVFSWVEIPACKFKFRGKTFRYDMGCDLQIKKLIQPARGNNAFSYFYQLTELGKTIEL